MAHAILPAVSAFGNPPETNRLPRRDARCSAGGVVTRRALTATLAGGIAPADEADETTDSASESLR